MAKILLDDNGKAIKLGTDLAGVQNVSPSNIKSGVTILGVTGTMAAGTGNPFANEKMVTFYDEYGYPKLYIPVSSLPLSALPTLPNLTWYNCVWDRTLQEVNAMTNGGRVLCNVTIKNNAPTFLYPNEFTVEILLGSVP